MPDFVFSGRHLNPGLRTTSASLGRLCCVCVRGPLSGNSRLAKCVCMKINIRQRLIVTRKRHRGRNRCARDEDAGWPVRPLDSFTIWSPGRLVHFVFLRYQRTRVYVHISLRLSYIPLLDSWLCSPRIFQHCSVMGEIYIYSV